MVLFGTLVNGALIILGSSIGLIFRTIPEKIKTAVIKVNGLFVSVLGLSMALQMEGNQVIVVLVSLVIGAVIGEWVDIDTQFNRLGNWVQSKFKSDDSNLSRGFVNSSLIFVIGAMAVLGALESGLRNNHEVLITKGILDGITSVVLSATMGFGVLLSAIPVMLYQGAIALAATQIDRFVSEGLLTELIAVITATGGVLIVGIGLNLLEIVRIKVANLLPSLVICCVIASIVYAVS